MSAAQTEFEQSMAVTILELPTLPDDELQDAFEVVSFLIATNATPIHRETGEELVVGDALHRLRDAIMQEAHDRLARMN